MRVLWQPGVLALLLCAAVAAVRRLLTLQARVRALEQQTITDPLTGAFNRRHMHEVLVTVVERHRRDGDPASLLLIDVDEFKSLNDAAGHAEGDRVLQAVAALAQRRLRRIDALFRFGGDEFVVLLAGARPADARRIAAVRVRTLTGSENCHSFRKPSMRRSLHRRGKPARTARQPPCSCIRQEKYSICSLVSSPF
jgi:diguanylate cyclase (GGDEF)-like protein